MFCVEMRRAAVRHKTHELRLVVVATMAAIGSLAMGCTQPNADVCDNGCFGALG